MNNNEQGITRESSVTGTCYIVPECSLSGKKNGPDMPLANSFYNYFDIVEINTNELMSEALKLRFQVYAVERKIPGFEESKYPNKMETDEYDCRSFHALLIHKKTKDIAGTVRLVCAGKDGSKDFPVESHLLPEHGFVVSNGIRHEVAEISRLMLSARFRSRQGEREWIDGLSDVLPACFQGVDNRRTSPHPVLGLMRACVAMSWKHGVRFFCASMESRLHRRLNLFGIHLSQVTPTIEFHGQVNVYFSSIPEIMRRCHEENKEVWRFLTDNGTIWPLDD